ncbi:MAG: hypothetical protein AB7H97_03930 [Pseudobdellovibrionaceae bacterium]
MKAIGLLLSIVVGFWSLSSSAAPNQKKIKQMKNQFITSGVLTGGQAGTGSTLMDIRRTASANKKAERVTLALGDMDGNRSAKSTYFHTQYDDATHRVIIDLSQTPNSVVDEKKLAQVFAKSSFVAKSDISADPEDRSLNITLTLKKKAKVRTYQAKAKDGQALVVLDMVQ